MKHLHYFRLLGLCFLCGGIQTSCVDNDYDLDNTDYTLGIETNITLPSCSTGDIYLRSFMDLEEDGVIQYVWDEQLRDSIFCVRETGSANIDPIRINEIKIAKPQLSQIETEINLRDMVNIQKQRKNKIKVTIKNPLLGNDMEIDVKDTTFIYDLKEDDAKYSIRNAVADHISTDIISIEKVGFDKVDVTLAIYLIGFPSYIPIMHLDHMSLSYPADLNITGCTFNGKECKVDNGKIMLSDDEGEAMKISDGVELKLSINGLQTGECFTFDPQTHHVELNGEFTLNGSFRIETAEFDTDALSDKINNLNMEDVQNFLAGNWNGLIPVSVGVKGNAEFDKDIVIKTFTGEVTHNVGSIAPIKLDDLPDFLNDDEVVLDLDNPVLLFTAEHDIPSSVFTSIELKSNTCETPVKTEKVTLDEGENKYYIADKTPNALPENYKDAKPVGFTGSVPALIQKIPERIDIDVEPVKLHAQELDITKSYNVDIDYEVFAPLTFGENFKLVYSDTEQGWAKDLDDLDDLNAEMLELKGKIDSDLPAEFELTLIPLDANGKKIDALEVNSVKANGNAKNQEFQFTIKAAKGHSLNDVLAGKNGVKQLDGIKYSARLSGIKGETLKKDASIRLHSMNVSVKGILSYDAN